MLIDVFGKDIGDGFMLDKLDLPKGVTPVNAERDAVIATIVSSRMTEEETTTEETTAPTEANAETTTEAEKKTA